MKPKVYITFPVKEDVVNYISEYCEVHRWEGKKPISRQELMNEIGDTDGLYTRGGRIDGELLDHAPQLKVVSNMSVGYNNFDLKAMKKRNIIGTNTPHVLNESVADLTFALILATARRISELDTFVKKGKWEPTTDAQDLYGRDVHNSTLGIIGMGRIGETIAKRAKFGFNMDVLYNNRNRRPAIEKELEIEYSELEPLLKQSDIVVLLTPLTDETFHLIGKKEFKLMKNTAVFVNVSRGQTIDEQALIQALKNNEIFGAGLDVFEKEPIEKDNPLLDLSNVVTVPHIGSATARTRDAMAMRAAENIVSVLTGKGAVDKVTR